eukprot:TRINITY_DN4494_c0_g1_i1.p1 TRINITY_DN4494_c0_g1~~TRINITY_DN4494_c0_g1_i1.p1  ORF type:complete len:1100 (-),score=161.24 TRINITY_DN4494_c0_g1_i1:652-3951(-)
MSQDYVAKLIRRAVDANTSIEGTGGNAPNYARALSKYFSNPKYVDIAYLKVIERVETSNPKFTFQILVKCVRLLRQNLVKYYPGDETLLHLDRFANRMQQQFSDANQALEYIRTLLDAISKTRHHKKKDRNSKRESLAVKDASKKPPDYLDPSKRAPSSPSVEGKSKPKRSKRPGVASSGAVPSTHGLRNRIIEIRRGWLTSNYILLRSRVGRGTKSPPTPRSAHRKPLNRAAEAANLVHQSVLSSPYFGGHFSSVDIAESADVFLVHDEDSIRDRIATVGMSKKNQERAMYRSFRRPSPLFQYKHYKDQSRLQLSENQLEDITNAMVAPRNDNRMTASKIFIKLILDAFVQDDVQVATTLLLSVLTEMIESSNVEARIHAFNLVFNLSVHVNMFEEVPFFNPTNPRGTTPAIFQIQAEIYQVVKQMLSMLLVCEETDRRVWFAGMNLLLFFATERGSIDKVRLLGLDVRIFVAIFQYVDFISDGVWRHLVRMLVNLLYMPDSAAGSMRTATPTASNTSLDMSAFSSGAISIKFIIDLYVRSRSLEARSNLFVVIFDYLRECYLRRRNPSSDSDSDDDEEENHILRQYKRSFELLISLEAHQFFPQLFKFVPDDFSEKMMEFFHEKCSRDSPTSTAKLHEIFSKIDSGILRELILEDFVRLAKHYSKLDAEHESALVRSKDLILAAQMAAMGLGFDASNPPTSRGTLRRHQSSASSSSVGSIIQHFSDEEMDGMGSVVIRGALTPSSASPRSDPFDNVLVAIKQSSNFHLLDIRTLLHSPRESDWRQGVVWLFQLRHSIAVAEKELADHAQTNSNTNHASLFAHIDSELDLIVESLLSSGLPSASRLAYLTLVEATLVWMRSSTSNNSSKDQIDFLNVALRRLASAADTRDSEKFEGVLMRIFDLIFSIVSISENSTKLHQTSDATDAAIAASSDFILSNQALDDSPACLFITGRVMVSMTQLRMIDISILHFTFSNLPPRYTCQMRAALLHLIIERCKARKEDIEAVGGTTFFKKLLNENDPQISYLASRFLIDMLQKEKPEQFSDIINTLLARAVEAYDEKLVSNPYLQIKAILEMQDSVGPRRQANTTLVVQPPGS